MLTIERMIQVTTYSNPSLREEPLNQPMKIAYRIAEESLLSWLENNDRLLKPSQVDDFQSHKITEDLDDILEPDGYAQESEDESSDE